MDERLRFVARLLEGEKMAPLCAEFGISRKTGYKVVSRYKECGIQAFTDRSRRAYRQANRLPAPLEAVIVHVCTSPTLFGNSHKPSAALCSRVACSCVTSAVIGTHQAPRGELMP
jgi:hypothetical protein